jgi:hypothetical protein
LPLFFYTQKHNKKMTIKAAGAPRNKQRNFIFNHSRGDGVKNTRKGTK